MNVEFEDNEEETQRTNQMIGEVMIDMGLIGQDDLDDALVEQAFNRRNGDDMMIGYQLIEMELITNNDLIRVYKEYRRRLNPNKYVKRKREGKNE